MLLAQLTDTHIKAAGKLAYRHVDTAALLAAAVDHINAFRPAIDAVVVTGDVTDMARPEEYDHARSILERLTMPVYLIPGNHDDCGVMCAAFPTHDYLQAGLGFIQYVVDDFPVRLVGLDTSVKGDSYGRLDHERLVWLDRTLSDIPDKPTFVFMHHPPFDVGIGHMDAQRLRNPDDLFDLLARHPQVVHVACGHVHRAVQTTLRGIAVSIAPNAAHAVTLNLAADAPPTFTMESPMLRLFRFADDGSCVSHLSAIGAFAPPQPFYEEDGGLVE